MTLDEIVNEVHAHLEPIRAQCDLFCSKAEEYAAMLEKYTREAIERHMAEFDRRQKERERLGVELLPGESFVHFSDGGKGIQPSPQEGEFQKGSPQEGWVWTQFCDYNYIDLPDMDTFWRPPEPSHPLEWLWLSLPWWGHTSPTLTRTKREWTNEERLMCECLWLAAIHDMRLVTAPSRHERIFHGRPYSGRFHRDKVANDLWYAMRQNPRSLEDVQLSWDWVKPRLEELGPGQPGETPADAIRSLLANAKPGDDVRTLPPLLPAYADFAAQGGADSDIDREVRFGMVAHSTIVYALQNKLTPSQRDNLLAAFRLERLNVVAIVGESLRRCENITEHDRIEFLREYESCCDQLVQHVEKGVKDSVVDTEAVNRLCYTHMNLMQRERFFLGLHMDHQDKYISLMKRAATELAAQTYLADVDREWRIGEENRENRQTRSGPGPAGETAAGGTPVEQIQLENGAYKILHDLNSSPTRLHQEDLTHCEDPPMDRRTVGRHLTELAKHGLIEYEPRNKKGATILEKGRAYLKSLPA